MFDILIFHKFIAYTYKKHNLSTIHSLNSKNKKAFIMEEIYMQKFKIIPLFLVIILCISTTSIGFSDYLTWSVLDNSIETSATITNSEQILDNNFLNL